MSALHNLQWLRPEWLLALLPLALLAGFAIRRRHGSQSWKAVCDEVLLPHVLTQPAGVRSLLPVWLAALAAALAIIAAAGPVWEKLPQPVFRDQSAVVIALDLSQSMDASDIKPSRLARARLKVLDMLKLRGSGQTALLVYAADAFVVAPLTDDTDTIGHLVPTLETGIMPAQGSNTLGALRKANELLQQAGITDGLVLLVTDGIDAAQVERIGDVMSARHRLAILGIGTAEGGPIPLTGGFLTDRDGTIVIPRLDTGMLARAAAAGGGRYRDMAYDDTDIVDLLALAHSDVDLGDDSLGLEADSWREEGPWLLLLVLPLAALFARRGWLGVLLLAVLPVGQDAQALEWQDLWRTPDQQGMRALEAGDAASAADRFSDPDWRAAAHYRAGEFDEAIAAWQEPASSDAFYNRGNAQARSGRLEQALADYERALELDPGNADAEHNRQLVEQAIASREQQSRQQQNAGEPGDDGEQGGSPDQANSQDQDQGQDPANANDQAAGQPQQGGDGERSAGDAGAEPRDAAGTQDPTGATAETEPEDAESEAAADAARAAEPAAESTAQQAAPGDEPYDGGQDREADAVAADRADAAGEQARATDQWLQRIPDDPGGLLRRKFLYQYKQRGEHSPSEQPW